MNPLHHVHRGDQVEANASTRNAMLDAGRAAASSRHQDRGRAMDGPTNVGVLLVRNDTGVDLPRQSVVGLGPLLAGLVDEEWTGPPCLSGQVPSAHQNFAVLSEPLAAGDVGRAIAGGVAVVKVTGSTSLFRADIDDGTTEHLVTVDEGGHAEVLHRDLATGLAVVRIDNELVVEEPKFRFAIVRTPFLEYGSQTTAVGGFTVDLYGATTASLSAPPFDEGVSATQIPAYPDRFFPGELVVAREVGGAWRIRKLYREPVVSTIGPGVVGFRLEVLGPPGNGFKPTNVCVDLADLVSLTASTVNLYWLAVTWGGYGGVMGWLHRVAVPLPAGGTSADLVMARDANSHPIYSVIDQAFLGGTLTSLSGIASSDYSVALTLNADDTYTESWEVLASEEEAITPNTIRYPWTDGFAEFIADMRGLTATLRYRWQATLDTSFWGSLPTIPAIPFAVDDLRPPLLLLQAQMYADTNVVGYTTITHKSPYCVAHAVIPAAGMTLPKRFDVNVTTYEPQPSWAVDPWLDVNA